MFQLKCSIPFLNGRSWDTRLRGHILGFRESSANAFRICNLNISWKLLRLFENISGSTARLFNWRSPKHEQVDSEKSWDSRLSCDERVSDPLNAYFVICALYETFIAPLVFHQHFSCYPGSKLSDLEEISRESHWTISGTVDWPYLDHAGIIRD